jgi:hypothetical protein
MQREEAERTRMVPQQVARTLKKLLLRWRAWKERTTKGPNCWLM